VQHHTSRQPLPSACCLGFRLAQWTAGRTVAAQSAVRAEGGAPAGAAATGKAGPVAVRPRVRAALTMGTRRPNAGFRLLQRTRRRARRSTGRTQRSDEAVRRASEDRLAGRMSRPTCSPPSLPSQGVLEGDRRDAGHGGAGHPAVQRVVGVRILVLPFLLRPVAPLPDEEVPRLRVQGLPGLPAAATLTSG
jgi:hypothetical protein